MYIYYMLKLINKLFQNLNFHTGLQFDNSIIWKVPKYFLFNEEEVIQFQVIDLCCWFQ